ncbi:hydroxysteroid 11-beta-dehydrogenase 1-like protein [Mercenaria mercenaria]|uniref:hydroxysteroid 11-beta-dehydrogenase 1-like protein n=1 Tax=Mercenaria mercenaria TaxID=6596 RepID=UPI00234F57D9|nr:hydroxysteroid 11-beta-dehydrogenase 1-like protein [Mercenaria mercenaria]
MIKKVLVVLCGIILGYWIIDDFDPGTVKGKRVVVTGASTGIGEQLAYHYARLGANIFITARRENRLKEVLQKCRKLGTVEQTYGYAVADMMELGSIENVIESAVQQLGGLDVLVLNHIIYFPLGVWKGSKENLTSVNKVMTVNFESYVHLASYSLPHLEKSNGSVIVLSSVAGIIGQPYIALYSSSKFALDGFFSSLRQELRLRNKDVSITNCIIGLVGTVKGKRVIVTGASTGIGEQLAYHYARLGANIVITARRENRLKEVLQKCRELGTVEQTYGYVVADMMELGSTENVIESAVLQLGGLDVLVLNHIFYFPLGVWKGSKDNLTSVNKVMTVNFESYVHLASYSLPHLEKSNGSVIVLSSIAGIIGQPYMALYCSCKFALDGFFSSLRQELRLRNKDVSITNCIIGLVATENALTYFSNQKYLLSVIKAESPSDTALAIVKQGALRVRQMYYPPSTYWYYLSRDWFPELVDWSFRYLYSET